MTTKRIVYTRPDGGVSIVVPAPGFVASFATEDEAIATIQAKDVPADATNVEVMDRAQIPALREYRNAWEKLGAGPPTVNMPKARLLHVERIDTAKRAKSRDLIERETMGKNVTAEKARFRAINVQAQIDAAATPEALSAIWPLELPR